MDSCHTNERRAVGQEQNGSPGKVTIEAEALANATEWMVAISIMMVVGIILSFMDELDPDIARSDRTNAIVSPSSGTKIRQTDL